MSCCGVEYTCHFINGIMTRPCNTDRLGSDKTTESSAKLHMQHLAIKSSTTLSLFCTAGTKTMVYSLHPGTIRTELTRHVSFITNYAIGRQLYYYLSWPFMKEPWNGAQTTICCAVDSKLETESGKYYR